MYVSVSPQGTPLKSEANMAKCHPFKKVKSGEPILVTARQLESFILEHNGRFNSRDYDKFKRMELMESPVRSVIHELKTYYLETLERRIDYVFLDAISAFLRSWMSKK